MKNLIRLKELGAVRLARLAASALAVAAVAGGAAGTAAAGDRAAPAVKADDASQLLKKAKFKNPKLKHGLLTVEGANASDRIVLRLMAGNPAILQIDVGDDGSADFSFDRYEIAKIAVDAANGDDLVRIDESNGAFTESIPTTIDGGDGDDNLAAGSGAETLLGGDGNDSIDGNRGNDVALMGAGDDTFVWDPGDGSDVVEGQDGADSMLFNGANVAEQIDLSANGDRLRFFRDVASVTMDVNDVETVDFKALGGADTITVNDLTGTDVSSVKTDLAATGGGGDGQPDRVIVNGTNGADTINVSGDATGVAVSGLPVLVAIQHQEPNDALAVNGLGGGDTISAASLPAGAIALSLDGGAGDDTITGGQGVETLLGGDGNDSIDGNRGNDVALMGAGDDTFVWDPGDGSDVVEGQDGADTMLFNGANVAEQIDLSANGDRLRFFRDVASVTMDVNDVETVDFKALGGADTITVNDLTGTDVSSVKTDLAATGGGGDGQPDRVIVNGTNGDDVINVDGGASGATVAGIAAEVEISHSEPGNDGLTINALAGDDVVSAPGLASNTIALTLDGGAGDDVLIGSAGNDILFGRDGDDVLLGGPGQDVLDGGPGNNILIQD